MVEHTGSKWNPNISTITDDGSETFLAFESAWAPMNPLLKRLHALTGWTIHNRFEEEQPEFEGEFHAEAGECREELRPGSLRFSHCEEQCAYDDLDPEFGECPSGALGRFNYLVTVEPDGAAVINLGETGSADLL
jgi:hypothetical protein